MGVALLIRHGRSTANVEGILAGRLPGVPLHASGRVQAQALANAFHGITCASIHVSPLERTLETATIIFGEGHFDTADELLECNYGTWTGHKLEELAKDPLWEVLHAQPTSTTFPGGESILSVAQRVIDFITRRAAADGLHVFVTHADPIMMAIGHAAGAPVDAYQRIDVEPCSLSALLVVGDRMGVVAVNVPPTGAAATLQSLQHWERTTVSGGGHDDANRPTV